jgi:ADP-glucose pyrophosphorylase
VGKKGEKCETGGFYLTFWVYIETIRHYWNSKMDMEEVKASAGIAERVLVSHQCRRWNFILH